MIPIKPAEPVPELQQQKEVEEEVKEPVKQDDIAIEI